MMNFYQCSRRGVVNNLITTERGYSLDARQGKILNDNLTALTTKVNDNLINTVNSFCATSSVGYIRLIRIQILTTYVGMPLRFTVIGRRCLTPITLTINFNDNDGSDPGLYSAIANGKFRDESSFKFYIARQEKSVWNIYVYHSAWTSFSVINAEYIKTWDRDFFKVTYPNELGESMDGDPIEFTWE